MKSCHELKIRTLSREHVGNYSTDSRVALKSEEEPALNAGLCLIQAHRYRLVEVRLLDTKNAIPMANKNNQSVELH